jgi:hypothetical protein
MMKPVQPNLARIPGDGDARAKAILQRAQATVTGQLLDSLNDRDYLALGRYGARQPTLALRQGSAALLHEALLATAIGELGHPDPDVRDVMVGLAVHHLVAQQIGQDPAVLFGDVAARLPDGPVADLLRQFGARQDITPKAFRWQVVQTVHGPDFIPVINH